MSSKSNNFGRQSDMTTLRHLAVKGGGLNIASSGISLVIQTVSVIILGRLLQPGDFGLVTMVTAFSLILMNFGLNGFTEYIVQKDTIEQCELSAIFWIHFFINSALMSAFIAAGPFLAQFYHDQRVVVVTVALSSTIVVQMLCTVQLALLKRRMEFGKLAIINILSGIISSVLAILLAIRGVGYWAIVSRQVSSVLVMSVAAWILCPWRPCSPRGHRGLMHPVRYALRVYGTFILGYALRSLDKILMGRYYGSLILGNYDRAYYVSTIPVEQLVTPLHSVGLSTLSRLREDRQRFLGYYLKALSTLSLIGMFASLILTIAGKDLIKILLGEGWDLAGKTVMAFGPGIGILIVLSTNSWLHLSLGNPERLLIWGLISLGVTSAMLLLTIHRGPVYVAAGFSIVNGLLIIPSLWYGGRPVKLRISNILKAVGPSFLSGLATSLLLASFFYFIKITASLVESVSPLVRIIIDVVIGGLFYVLLIAVLERSFISIRNLLSLVMLAFNKIRREVTDN